MLFSLLHYSLNLFLLGCAHIAISTDQPDLKLLSKLTPILEPGFFSKPKIIKCKSHHKVSLSNFAIPRDPLQGLPLLSEFLLAQNNIQSPFITWLELQWSISWYASSVMILNLNGGF